MSGERGRSAALEKILLWLQSALCVLVVIMLSSSVVQAYTTGLDRRAEDPAAAIFTPENAETALMAVLPLVLMGVVLAAFCLAKGIRDEGADRPVSNAEVTRDRCCARVSVPTDAMMRERTYQRRMDLVSRASVAACMVPIALHLIDPDHFASSDVEGLETMVTGVVANVLPLALLAASIRAVTHAAKDKSMEHETSLAKERAKEEKAAKATATSKTPTMGSGPSACLGFYRMATAAIALIFIVAGILNGTMEDVLVKATKICAECIGLG